MNGLQFNQKAKMAKLHFLKLSFLYSFIYLLSIIYLFLAVSGLVCCAGFSLFEVSRGYTSYCGRFAWFVCVCVAGEVFLFFFLIGG